MRAFITGITGFAGSHLAEHLLAVGDTVAGCARGGRNDVLPPNVAFTPLDLGTVDDVGRLDEALRQFEPEVIYHLAAISVPADCGAMHATPWARDVNVGGCRRVLEAASRLKRPPRVIVVSSCHVYAPVRAEQTHVDETAPLAPRNGYAQTKIEAEQATARIVAETGLDAIVVRAFQHAGPRQNVRLMLASWARQLARPGDAPLEVHTLDAWLDLTDVRDMVRAYRRLALDGHGGQTYNVGSGVARRSGDVLEIALRLAGSTRRVVETHPTHKQEPIAELTKLRSTVAWEPQIPIEQTVLDTLNYERRATR